MSMNYLPNNIAERAHESGLFSLRIGLECEGVRVTPDARIARTQHPAIFGNKLTNPYITVDYAEQQVEVITPACPTEKQAYDFVRTLREIVEGEAKEQGEFLWPFSLPPRFVDSAKDIEIAHFDDSPRGQASRAYREELARRYGKEQQLISGVHFNFSFDERLLELCGGHNEAYMKVARNYHRYGWLLVYLLGASPDQTGKHPLSVSKRNGREGYRNQEEIYPDCSSLENYVKSVRNFIEQDFLSEPKELYSPLRLKPHDPRRVLESLEEQGITYLEIRSIDLNPFDEAGMALEDIRFMRAFVLYLLLAPEPPTYACWLHDADQNILQVADNGLDPHAQIKLEGAEVPLRKEAQRLVNEIAQLAHELALGDEVEAAVSSVSARAHDPENLLYAARIKRVTAEQGYFEAGVQLGQALQRQALKERWLTPGYEEWEMSTQLLIKEALKRGIVVEPIDVHDNILRLTRDGRVEYVQQATKTSADSYITPLLMNNKVVTKKVLSEAGINVPEGLEFTRSETKHALRTFVGRPAVVKPKSTNFGQGITIFEQGADFATLCSAAEVAFGFDDVIIVETFVPGLEYRFLVIDGKVAGVLHRAPAQVRGDGVHTISELIAEKNKHPYRSTGYRTPLISIQLGPTELEYLAREHRDGQTIPGEGEVVFLRPNSNISTGGDSIDVTDKVASVFLERAGKAAQAFGAAFCGVDMIIENLDDPHSSWAIIEVNFNPAIHIHSFPMEGSERNIAALVLDTIFGEREQPKSMC